MVDGEVDQAKKSFMGMPVSSFDHSTYLRKTSFDV
jgi:hypothetical protein